MAYSLSIIQRKLFVILKIWLAIATNVRMRDRMVKVVQYGCQMLLGFYGAVLDKSLCNTLSLCRRTASTSRKMFWILKSLNHTHDVITMLPQIMANNAIVYSDLFGLTEQLFLIVYYALENVVLLNRLQLVSLSEDELDPIVNWTWFGGDFAGVAAVIARLLSTYRNGELSNSKVLFDAVFDLSIVSSLRLLSIALIEFLFVRRF